GEEHLVLPDRRLDEHADDVARDVAPAGLLGLGDRARDHERRWLLLLADELAEHHHRRRRDLLNWRECRPRRHRHLGVELRRWERELRLYASGLALVEQQRAESDKGDEPHG